MSPWGAVSLTPSWGVSLGSEGRTVYGLARSPMALWQVRELEAGPLVLLGRGGPLAQFSMACWMWAPLWTPSCRPVLSGEVPAMEGDRVSTACPRHAVCDQNRALALIPEHARRRKAGVATAVDIRAGFVE